MGLSCRPHPAFVGSPVSPATACFHVSTDADTDSDIERRIRLTKYANVSVAAGKTSNATRSSACKVLPRGVTGVPAMLAMCTFDSVTGKQYIN